MHSQQRKALTRTRPHHRQICVRAMRSPEFWAAVRLVAFANLSITQENWRTLWILRLRTGRLWLPSRPVAPVLNLRRLPSLAGTLFAKLGKVRLRVRELRKGHALWFDFADHVGRYEDKRRRDFWAILRASAVASWAVTSWGQPGAQRRGDVEALRPWPSRGRDGDRLTYGELKRLHEKTRARLAAICEDRDV